MRIEVPEGSGNFIKIDKEKWDSASESQKIRFIQNETNNYNSKKIKEDQIQVREDAYEKEDSTVGEKVVGSLRGIGQGLGLGFGDEIEAGVRTGFGLLGDYGETVQGIRDDISDFYYSDPGLAYGTEIGGAILPAILATIATAPAGGTGGAGVIATTGARIAGQQALRNALKKVPGSATASNIALKYPQMTQGAKVGGLYGGAYGMGTAESDPDATVYEIAKDRLTGLGGGALTGATIGAPLQPVLNKTLGGANALYQNIKKTLGNKDALETNVNQTINKAIDKDGGIQTIGQRIEDQTASPTVLADAGENTRWLAYGTQQIENASRNPISKLIIERNQAQSGRIMDALKSSTGINDEKLGLSFIDDLSETTRTLSAPAYQEAYTINIPASKFKDFFTGSRKDTLLKASEIARRELAVDGISVPALEKMWGNKNSSFFGSFDDIMSQDLSTEFLHAIKRGLDTMIKKETKIVDRTFREVSPLGQKLTKLKNEFNDIIKANNPSYASANKTFADQKSLERAFMLGQKYKSTSIDKIKNDVEKMTAPELQAWKSGMMTKLDEIAQGQQQNRNFLTEVGGSGKLDEIFEILLADNPTQLKAFRNFLKSESDMFQTYSKLRLNSDTASKTKAIDEFESGGKSIFDADGFYGLTKNIIKKGAEKTMNVVSGGTNAKRAELIAQRLFATDIATQRAVLKALEKTNEKLAKEVQKRLDSATTLTAITTGEGIN